MLHLTDTHTHHNHAQDSLSGQRWCGVCPVQDVTSRPFKGQSWPVSMFSRASEELLLRSRKYLHCNDHYFWLLLIQIGALLSFTFITDILCIPKVFQPKIKVKHKQHLKICVYVNEIKHKDRHKNTFSSWKDCWLCFSTHQTTGARKEHNIGNIRGTTHTPRLRIKAILYKQTHT